MTFIEEQRQVVFGTLWCSSLTDFIEDTASFGVAIKTAVPIDFETLNSVGVQREFSGRQQVDSIEPLRSALGFRIKTAKRLNLAIKEINSEWLVATHWKDIQE